MGFAAVFQNNIYSERLPSEAPIFTAEMYAIRTGSTKILEANRENESALLSLKSEAGVSPVVQIIKTIIQHVEAT